MNIDRHNYEEFFILYLDNELTPEQRQRVDLFVQENPDLASELDLLIQSKLVPDGDIVFGGKEDLMKEDEQVSISLNNYEEWLLLYADNELSEHDKLKVEEFANKYPAVKTDLEIFHQTRLQPDNNIIFFDKESLYRTEEKVRVVPFNWKRIAAAAAILLTVGITATLLYNNNHTQTPPDGIAAGGQEKIVPLQKPVLSIKEDSATTLSLAENSAGKENKVAPESIDPVVAKKENGVKRKPAIEVREKLAPEQKEMAVVKEEKKTDNNLPKPTYNPNMKMVEEPAILASNTPDLREPLTNPKEIKPLNSVTSANAQPLYTSNTSSGANDEPEMEQSGRKNKLRGFFRKITRTFEKNTNIKATDDDDRLLLGGLAIKL